MGFFLFSFFFTENLYSNEDNYAIFTGPFSIHLKLGLFGFGTEIEKPVNQERNTIFLNFQEEGFGLIGSWSTMMLGMKRFNGESFYIKYACGWYSTKTFGNVSRYGPAISISLGWRWLKEYYYWGFEAGGLGLNYLVSDHDISGYMHVPSVYIGREF